MSLSGKFSITHAPAISLIDCVSCSGSNAAHLAVLQLKSPSKAIMYSVTDRSPSAVVQNPPHCQSVRLVVSSSHGSLEAGASMHGTYWWCARGWGSPECLGSSDSEEDDGSSTFKLHLVSHNLHFPWHAATTMSETHQDSPGRSCPLRKLRPGQYLRLDPVPSPSGQPRRWVCL